MNTKQQCTRFCQRLTGKTLRILLIRAGFPIVGCFIDKLGVLTIVFFIL
ncbi:MAG: hypothetical protein GY801_46840 [bacterium]|nr:hypothetical protein [bacterium]